MNINYRQIMLIITFAKLVWVATDMLGIFFSFLVLGAYVIIMDEGK